MSPPRESRTHSAPRGCAAASSRADPDRKYKRPLPPGQLLAASLLAVLLTACAGAPASPSPAGAATNTAPAAATLSATATPLPLPTGTATAAPSETPTATSTPPPLPRPLTTGGCCVQPSWSPDGRQVWYLDRPDAASPSGLWGVSVDGGPPQFITDRLGLYSPDRALMAYPEGGQTIIERLATGERWVAPSAGRAVSFSPDGQLIAWSIASSSVNFDRRQVEVWAARVDGSEARVAARLQGGGFSGWLPDSQHLLISGRDEDQAAAGSPEVQYIGVLSLADGGVQKVVSSKNLRGTSLSPEGGWLLYTIAFSGDPAVDGQWVVPLGGGEPRRLELYGAIRWRSEGKLLMIPLEWGGEAGLRVVEIDAATGAVRALTDPAQTPLPIGGGDWALSPDGQRLAFVSAEDRNIWVLDLPT
jgi:dipeptidyl aminopeptidase/acylaminoacyl peptidase